jgi:hypothetical protein
LIDVSSYLRDFRTTNADVNIGTPAEPALGAEPRSPPSIVQRKTTATGTTSSDPRRIARPERESARSASVLDGYYRVAVKVAVRPANEWHVSHA